MSVALHCSPVAVAIFDYEALADPGEEDNLEFQEGDLIEVRGRSWWVVYRANKDCELIIKIWSHLMNAHSSPSKRTF